MNIWIIDFMTSPPLKISGSKKRLCLVVLMHYPSRLILDFRWCYFKQRESSLEEMFENALCDYDPPQFIYCDSGIMYDVPSIIDKCDYLNVPVSELYKGRSIQSAELFFMFVRNFFCQTIDDGWNDLDSVNQLFNEWVHYEYHSPKGGKTCSLLTMA